MKVVSGVVSIITGLVTCLALSYFVLFLNNWQPSPSLPSIDHKPQAIASLLLVPSSPTANNILLMLLFTLPHTLITFESVKRLLINYLLCSEKKYYLLFYSFWASVSLLFLYTFWSPSTSEVWSIRLNWAALAVHALQGIFLILYLYSLLSTEILGNFGLVWFVKSTLGLSKIKKEKGGKENKLVISGIYGVVRHPLMTCTIAMMWLTPTMTIGHLFLAALFTLYIVLAVRFSEEPKLIKEYGIAYTNYQRKVPCQLIPGIY
ncbi:PREDICTED: nurim-like [Amphimedon queenslandica]|nr:PREDICTED: nurim-like [Amphimedon queenslandica]|eukprot:XP_019848983.1 PREDICTED: nurim-like [Amphimedon queenslandica]